MILGAFAVAGMLAMSVNSVQAVQEEYTAGSSMGKEYDELEQAYSDDEVLATASNQGHWEVNYAGWWYQYSDGTYPRSSWVNISNKWYYFDENGKTNWTEYNKACNASPRYVFDANGVMVTGWYHDIQTTGGQITYDRWYYSDSDGKCHDGWLLYNGAWYYFSKGEMLRNTYTPDGNWVGLDGVWA